MAPSVSCLAGMILSSTGKTCTSSIFIHLHPQVGQEEYPRPGPDGKRVRTLCVDWVDNVDAICPICVNAIANQNTIVLLNKSLTHI